MSLAEIKEEIRQMSAEERAEVQRHLRLLKWSEDPETPKRLAAAHAAMDAGRKVTQEQVEAFIAERRQRLT
jgi:ribosomal protein L29